MSVTLADVAKDNDIWLQMAESFTDCQQKAKDLLQETYLYLHRRLSNTELKPLTEVTKGYMYNAIKFNFYMDKRKKTKEYLDEDIETRKVFDEPETLEARKELDKQLNKIPYLEREVLLKHQEMSQRQLQKETGVCRDRLRVYKNRALEKLKDLCKEDNLKEKLYG